MSDQILDNNGQSSIPAGRPTFLTVLCILTFIGSGLGVLTYVFSTVAFTTMYDMLLRVPGMEILLAGGVAFFAVLLALAIISLLGAVQMWQLKKSGFYMYVGANLAAFLVPIVMLGIPFDMLGFALIAIWIGMYAANFKYLR